MDDKKNLYKVDAKLHFVAHIEATSIEEAQEKFMESITAYEGELFGEDFVITQSN